MTTLSPIDALFLGVETAELPAHVAGVQIYQLPRGKSSRWLQQLMETLRKKPAGSPFNLRLKPSSIGLPQMIEDPDFDIDYHLRHIVLPAPGSEEQLAAEVARLHSNLLDRDRPLWEFHLIEGLSDRRFAFYIKIHHAICDGATFAMWMADATSKGADGVAHPIWERVHAPQGGTPRPWLEALQAPVSVAQKTRELSLGLGRYALNVARGRLIDKDSQIALPLSGPQTALNGALTASRNLAFLDFPLDELKAIGKTVDGTINDVVLAISDAAVLRYLSEQGQQPEKPLVAAVPVNLRKAGESVEGNFVTSLQVKLGQAGQTPLERLRTIRHGVRKARELCDDVPASATQVVSFGTAILAALGSALHLEGVMPPPINVIVSNVPGPREQRYFGGAKLEATYPVSGIAPMTALNVTVFSYNGTLYFGLTSARRMMPQLNDLKLCFEEIYEEFRQDLLPTPHKALA